MTEQLPELPEHLMWVLAATVKRGDLVVFMGQERVVEHVANATPRDGMISWELEDWDAPVPVPATRKVAIKRHSA